MVRGQLGGGFEFEVQLSALVPLSLSMSPTARRFTNSGAKPPLWSAGTTISSTADGACSVFAVDVNGYVEGLVGPFGCNVLGAVVSEAQWRTAVEHIEVARSRSSAAHTLGSL
jgi:hypothetical protein